MFQFRNRNTAVMAAQVLAVREVRPILVMACATRDVYSIGLQTNPALLAAGTHVATVYGSGRVTTQH